MNSELEKIAYVYGDVCVRRKKQRRKRQKLLVIELLFDYAKNSTLHGLRYIVDHTLNIVERLFWFLTVIANIALCSFYIYNVVQKWKTSPVIVTVNGRLSSVGSVPFPAVTICPRMKVNPFNYNYTEKKDMFDGNASLRFGEEYEKFLHIGAMCEDLDFDGFYYTNHLKLTNSSMVNDIKEASSSLNELFTLCNWQNSRAADCSNLFNRVITEDGVCFTSNGLAAAEIFENSVQSKFPYIESNTTRTGWSIEEGYDYAAKTFYPRRGRVFGSDPDLTLVLANDPERTDKKCNKVYSGYKIYLHHPADLPQSSLYYYAALPNQLSSVAISFHEFNSDDGLADYDPVIRQCYFPTDRKLRYFKIYTARNCQAECLSNYTYYQCKCVGFYMPWHNSGDICFPNEMNDICMRKAKDMMALRERKVDLGLIKKHGCNCLPSCNTVEYDAEILKTDFRLQELMADFYSQLGISSPTSYSKIDLFFKKPQFVTMQRRELFGVTDLLANIGGLLGVFLGFSFLSLIEILYFLTVRVAFILKRDLEEEKTKEKSKIGDAKIK